MFPSRLPGSASPPSNSVDNSASGRVLSAPQSQRPQTAKIVNPYFPGVYAGHSQRGPRLNDRPIVELKSHFTNLVPGCWYLITHFVSISQRVVRLQYPRASNRDEVLLETLQSRDAIG